MLKYCLMHTLHLGLLHWVNGGAVLCLINHDFFGTFELRTFLYVMWFYDVICIFLPVNQSCSSQPIQLGGPRGEKLSVQLEVLSLRFRRWVNLHSIPNPGIPNGSKYGMRTVL